MTGDKIKVNSIHFEVPSSVFRTTSRLMILTITFHSDTSKKKFDEGKLVLSINQNSLRFDLESNLNRKRKNATPQSRSLLYSPAQC